MTGKQIKSIAANEGISLTELSERIGISRQALYKRLNGNMRTSSFVECLKAMGYELYYGKDGRVKKL
jgi:transcriptional regulator with XRE-family HTH domain